MSSPIGPGCSPISTTSATSPSAVRKFFTDKPTSSGSAKIPKEKDATVTKHKPDMEGAVPSPGSSGSRGGDSATKLPFKPKPRPSNTAPMASTATGEALKAPIQALMTSPKAPPTLPQSLPTDTMDDSDSEDIESDLAAKKGNIEISSHESVSSTSSHSASPTPAASSSTPKDPEPSTKTKGTGAVKKRVRSNTSSNATPAKRPRSNPQSRAAPHASYNAASLVGEFTNFTTSIFIVQLGPEIGPNCPKFHVHESVLARSPILAHDIEVAKGAKTLTRKNILSLLPHDPVAFEQMLQFLYKDTFILKSHTSGPLEARLNEIHELFSLAKHYVLPGLQRQVVKVFSQSRMVGKMSANRFFDWSENMYYEELDKEGGPFRGFFARVAPGLVKRAKEGEVKEIAKIVGQGGGFAGEIFRAMYAALEQETRKAVVKKEEGSPIQPAAHKSEGFVDAHSSSL